jgi:hypothetical protein
MSLGIGEKNPLSNAFLAEDSVLHGAAARTNPAGWRKTVCFRYLPQVDLAAGRRAIPKRRLVYLVLCYSTENHE